MEPTSVFVKTQNGHEEVRVRSQRLSARERATLIMVDGNRSVAELCMMSPIPAEVQRHLQTFLESGLIAASSDAAQENALDETPLGEKAPIDSRKNGSPLSPIDLAAVPSVSGSFSAFPGAVANADLEKARQYILEVAEETLGVDAASFTEKLAQLRSTEEMLNLAHHLRDVLYRFTNMQEADQFLQTVREIAPKA